MISSATGRVVAVSCGPLPEEWVQTLSRAATEASVALEAIALSKLPALDEVGRALSPLSGPVVLLAPRGTQFGGACALTLARLVSSLPVLEWTPESAPEAVDLARRILALAASHPAVDSQPAPQSHRSATPTPPAAAPASDPAQPYLRPRMIRVDKSDHSLPDSYEDQLRRRAVDPPSPPPPPPLPLSAAMQTGLARAGARVRADRSGLDQIQPIHLLVSLLEITDGAIAAVCHEAGVTDLAEVAMRLRRLAHIDSFHPDQPTARRAGIVPSPELTALLDQTRREGRSRGAAVASTRDFLRSVVATASDLRSALIQADINVELVRELMDDQHFPDAEEMDATEEVADQAPMAQPGWPDPLRGLDPQTRAELTERLLREESAISPVNVPPPQRRSPTPAPPAAAASPRAPARMRRLTLHNPEMPDPDMVDSVVGLLNSGKVVLFPSDLGLHALGLLDSEETASRLLRFRRSLQLPGTEILIPHLRALGGYPSATALRTHQRILGELGDHRAAVRLPWERTHSAIESLDETPRTGWHRGWRIPAHTALLAVLSTLGRPVLALAAAAGDPSFQSLIDHDSQPVAMAILPARPMVPESPLILDLRPAIPRIDHPGTPPQEAGPIRQLLEGNPA